jgi:hypothetical protein
VNAARMAAIVLALAAAVALPAPARAGSYEVSACAITNGGAQNAFVAAAYPGMAAYTACPNTPSNPASGLVTRASASAGPGAVPMLAGAYQVFEAPPGASLASVSFDVAAIRLASYWTTGIVAFDGNFDAGLLPYGCYAGNPGCSIGSQSFFGPVSVGLGGHSKFRFETRCGNPGGCDISATGFQPGMRALFSAANVVVRVNDFSAPSITPVSGSLWSGGWQRGAGDAWQMLSDNVGIMLLHLYADGKLVDSQDYRQSRWPDHLRCDFTRRQPCSGVLTGGMLLDTRTVPDGTRTIRVEAVDAAGNSAQAERTILVDNTPPPPAGAAVEGGEDWRQANGFAVRWAPGGEDGSAVARVHYSLCRSAGACSQEVRPAREDRLLDGITLPAPGEYTLRLWLEDAAGNVEPANASAPVRLRFDDVAPHAAFLGLDDRDPLKIELPVSEQGSGMHDGVVELRRVGRRQWQELETAVGASRLVARIDDTDLPDGTYELRASVRDRAGNERTTDRRIDGSRMELTLPLRNVARLALRTEVRCKRGRRGRSCRRRAARLPQVVHGNGKSVLGRLEANGHPLAGARIGVYAQSRQGAPTSQVATVVTDSGGRFRHPVGSGPSRALRYRYEGTATIKPAAAQMAVQVRARTSAAVDHRRLRNGDTVRFSGRLLGGPVPDGGKLIDLQAHYRGQWRTFATPRTDAHGRWQYDYRFEATRGLVRYRFRARIRREAAYPYELGYSRVLRVIVRGP